MFGCLRRLGCLVLLLLILAGVGYWYWSTRVVGTGTTASASGAWQRVTTGDADVAARQINALAAPGGRVFANLTPAQGVAYLLVRGANGFPPEAQDVQAAVRGDTLLARAVVALRDLGGGAALGPIGALVGARDTVQLAGVVHVIRPGLAEFRVTHVAVQGLQIPGRAIPNLMTRLRRNPDPALSPDGLPIDLAPYIGDVRIANGRITLYKNVSQ